MGTGINKALDLIEERKATYRANGIAYYRPWVFMITDGEPQGEPPHIVETAAARIKEQEESKRVAFFAVGVGGANMDRLRQISYRSPRSLQGLNFDDLFMWLSASLAKISESRPEDESIPLPSDRGWSRV